MQYQGSRRPSPQGSTEAKAFATQLDDKVAIPLRRLARCATLRAAGTARLPMLSGGVTARAKVKPPIG